MKLRRLTRTALGFALVIAIAVAAPAPAHARWSAEPTLVHATTNVCPLVAAASDAADGAIVTWQRNDGTNPSPFPLIAMHLLANGDIDSQWPVDGVLVSSATTISRTALGAVGDATGGAYVWWMEGSSLYLTRVAPGGTVPSAWPARGRLVGTLDQSSLRPQAYADGSGGVYLGWLSSGNANTRAGQVMRLGPNNSGNGGWPNSPRAYALSSSLTRQITIDFAFNMTRDGGFYFAWGTLTYDEAFHFLPGAWKVARVWANGVSAPDWPASGTVVSIYRSDTLLNANQRPKSRTVAVAEAEDGGVYLMCNEISSDPGTQGQWWPRLHKLAADRTVAPGWPSGGIRFESWYGWPVSGTVPGMGYLLEADSSGTAYASYGVTAVDVSTEMRLLRSTPTGAMSTLGGFEPAGLEWCFSPRGVLYLADYFPSGPTGPWAPYACIHARRVLPGSDLHWLASEWDDRPAIRWYGDVALAPTSSDGAIFFWSQYFERFGIYARRFALGGEVTDVPAAPAAPRTLRLRFEPGRGVVASGALAPGSRVNLLDVSGRRVGASEAPADGALECVLPGSAALAPGVYFARATDRTGALVRAKVAVWR